MHYEKSFLLYLLWCLQDLIINKYVMVRIILKQNTNPESTFTIPTPIGHQFHICFFLFATIPFSDGASNKKGSLHQYGSILS